MEIWSLASLPPRAQPLLVFSVYPTWYHSVTFATSSLFAIIFSPCSSTFIGPLPFSHHVSLPCFHPSLCRSLNPLSFALFGPHPSHFSSCSLRAVFAAVPFPPTGLRFPSFFLIHFLPASGFIHPPLFYLYKEHHHPSLLQVFQSPSCT